MLNLILTRCFKANVNEEECSRTSVDEYGPITHKGTLIRAVRSKMTESLLVQGQLGFSQSSIRKK